MSGGEKEGLATAADEPAVTVSVADSQALLAEPQLARRLLEMINTAYGHRRIGFEAVRSRITAGDSGCPNRVLHLGWREGVLVGCCSSTVQPPWTLCGCGHWGMLVVDRAAQGSGVASALVAAAEQRLASAGCVAIQIEYNYTAGDPLSERLRGWYEAKLGFQHNLGSGFRLCHKWIVPRGCPGRFWVLNPCCGLCAILMVVALVVTVAVTQS